LLYVNCIFKIVFRCEQEKRNKYRRRYVTVLGDIAKTEPYFDFINK